MPFTGGCLCGAVRYEIATSHLKAMNCYCSMCRKAHGGAFSTHVVTRAAKFSWTQGAEDLVRYRSSQQGVREFCRHCGSHLLVHGQTADDTFAIPAGTIDGNPQIELLGEMFTSERVGWHPAGAPSRDRLPQHEEWPPGVVATHPPRAEVP